VGPRRELAGVRNRALGRNQLRRDRRRQTPYAELAILEDGPKEAWGDGATEATSRVQCEPSGLARASGRMMLE